MHGLTVAGHQLMAWSVGVTATTVFLDLGPGFTRDHPPLDRRISGEVAAPLAVLSLLCLAVDSPWWVTLLLGAPYALMSCVYALAWLRGAPAAQRRRLGWQTGTIGGAALLVLMMVAGPDNWNGGVVMSAYATSVGLLGGFTFLLIRSATIEKDDGVETSDSPYGIPARAIGVGLGISLLGTLDMLYWVVEGHPSWLLFVSVWTILSLVVPGVLMALGHGLYPKLQRLVWGIALLSALSGQAGIHAVTLLYPGLVPPPTMM